MTLRLIIPPDAEPVSLATARLQCRIDHEVDDSLLAIYIATARRQAEHMTGRAYITQTWERVLDAFPRVEISLGMPPVRAVLQVTYLDTAGVTQVVPAANYVLDDVRSSGWVVPVDGYTWPTAARSAGAVRVMFKCGMGDTPEDITKQAPELQEYILLQVGAMNENRAAIAQGRAATALPENFGERLLDRLRTY